MVRDKANQSAGLTFRVKPAGLVTVGGPLKPWLIGETGVVEFLKTKHERRTAKDAKQTQRLNQTILIPFAFSWRLGIPINPAKIDSQPSRGDDPEVRYEPKR